MPPEDLEEVIIERGECFFQNMQGQKPSLFNKNRAIGKMMDWVMSNECFKFQLFRFVDVFPTLKTSKSVVEHIHEYFLEGCSNLPSIMKWIIWIGNYGGLVGAMILNKWIAFHIKCMAKQFIIGENTSEAMQTIAGIREEGLAYTIDVLGEATITEEEAENYQLRYLELLRAIGHHQRSWKGLQIVGVPLTWQKDWGYAPLSQISIKVSGLYARINLMDFENSVNAILERLKPIYRRVIEVEGALCIDMETYQLKPITLEVFRRLRSDPEFKHYSHLGIALQSYLRETAEDLNDILDWARNNALPIEIRLVKGAYWDYETITAQKNGWTPRVWGQKAQTDVAFEELARTILEHHDICYLACGSHNIRSIAAVLETAKELGVPEGRYEFQLLYGMGEPVSRVLKENVGRVRLYCPYGEMIAGMGYLVRRLLENTANESFLRQSFVKDLDMKTLLQNPKKLLK